ncbi:LPXTG cell wall anchor domain-containing protein [Sporosarcina highlanderae]|uniref:LPXTG cell wall anchor domain-containing protein n=1 Tax=Sporosarcina highlanderae TaxID=3035916 RepID=A0ABT8JR84_9BACL|nr:LPXTG cell wall anchor domain-containing protein [Sporosarcina highlanderae]MDN4607670.1 LPXTG cell wall anchor domain-containing protein [Sporosarcina highlanderae]
MVDDISDERIAELREKLGLSKPEPLKSTFFQGDFGYSINLTELISILLLLLVGAFLFVYRRRKNKRKSYPDA